MADAETAFAAPLAALAPGAGDITMREVTELGIATVMARAGQTEAAFARLRDAFGLAASDAPRRAAAGPVALIGTGPSAWLLLKERAGADWADEAEAALGDAASVFDQSSGYAVLRLSGAAAARLLQKGIDIDLHAAAFPPGSVAVTVIAYLGVILWRVDEASFEIAVFRSMAESFWHWLTGAAAMAGLTLHRPDQAETA